MGTEKAKAWLPMNLQAQNNMEPLVSPRILYEISKGINEKSKALSAPAWLNSFVATQGARTDVENRFLHARLKDALLTQPGMTNEPESNAIRKKKNCDYEYNGFWDFHASFLFHLQA